MEQIYFTRQDMLAAHKEGIEQDKGNAKGTPKALYAVRHANGLFVAYCERNTAMYEVLDDLCNEYRLDFEETPLVYTDMNSKWGWEQCWMEKFLVAPCI